MSESAWRSWIYEVRGLRTRNNKLINFILEFSQILLVFFGVYSALACGALGIEVTFDKGLCTILLLLASILFYGLFTVLETFRRGKLYGVIGISAFCAVIVFRFRGTVWKGCITMANSFLKQYMNYSGSNLSLFTFEGDEKATVTFCTTFVLALLGVYLIAIISAFFYRKRRASIFITLTLPFVLLPLVAGRIGYFSNVFTYLVILVTVIGTRHLRTDATDRRMRQKLSFILVFVGLVAGGISYAVVTPEKYGKNERQIIEARNSVIALTNWSVDDIFTWVKAHFNGDALDYGQIGNKSEVVYNGETLIKISGDVNAAHGMYLKGYVGDIYEDNHWSSLSELEDYKKDFEALEDRAVTTENWHVQLRNELGDSERSGVSGIWSQGSLRIRNIAFGYGNYLVPYLPTDSFLYSSGGRIAIERPGIDYVMLYYPVYPVVQRRDVLLGNPGLANYRFWSMNEGERNNLSEFAHKYYLQVPESLQEVSAEFQNYLDENKYMRKGEIRNSDMITAVKMYLMENTQYTLSPGRTPDGKDSVEYFINENKKGYCVYYATAAVMLLRSVGIPARYAEGMYVPKEELAKCAEGKEINVLDRNAHAWVEIYDDKYGFVPVEVTPGFGEDAAMDSNSDTPDNNNNSDIPGDDSKEQPEDKPDKKTEQTPKPNEEKASPTPIVSETPQEDMVFDDIERNGEDDAAGQTGDGDSSGIPTVLQRILEVIAVILLLMAVIEVQRRIRRYIFERNLKRLRMKKRIRMVHHHLMILLAQRGVIYRRQSMAEYTREISVAMEMPYDKIYDYVSLVYRARFGPDDITEEDMAVFRITYENIRRKAYENAKFLQKIYYMYIMVL